jgi:hypothetical protein
MALGSMVQGLRMTSCLLTFSLVSIFMAVSVACGDTDRHLNLADQLDNAQYFCPSVV